MMVSQLIHKDNWQMVVTVTSVIITFGTVTYHHFAKTWELNAVRGQLGDLTDQRTLDKYTDMQVKFFDTAGQPKREMTPLERGTYLYLEGKVGAIQEYRYAEAKKNPNRFKKFLNGGQH